MAADADGYRKPLLDSTSKNLEWPIGVFDVPCPPNVDRKSLVTRQFFFPSHVLDQYRQQIGDGEWHSHRKDWGGCMKTMRCTVNDVLMAQCACALAPFR